MFEFDSKTYKFLKHMNKVDDWVEKTDKNRFEMNALFNQRLLHRQEIWEYKINEAGKRYVSEHRKQTIKSWVVVVAAVSAAIIGLITLLSR